MSTITVLYFAQASRLAGVDREAIEWPGGTVSALRRTLLERYPALQALESSLLLAVDEELAAPEAEVSAGQTVAVMPPFSGG